MKKFSYKSRIDNVDVVLDFRQKKINKQQLVYIIFFCLLCLSLAIYLIYNLTYSRFSGAIRLNRNMITLVDDAYILSVNVKAGDRVKAGDTLFTYLMVNQIYKQFNFSDITSMESEYFRLDLQKKQLQGKVEANKQKTHELRKSYRKEQSNMIAGLTTLEKVEALRRMIKDLEIEILTQEKDLELLSGQISIYTSRIIDFESSDLPTQYTQEDLETRADYYGKAHRIYSANTDSYIAELKTFSGMTTYKKEVVMIVQPISPDDMDLHITVWISSEELHRIQEGDEMDIFLAGENIGRGKVTLVGATTENLGNKQSRFTFSTDGVLLRLNLNKGVDIPHSYRIDQFPVRLRLQRKTDFGNFMRKILNRNSDESTQDTEK